MLNTIRTFIEKEKLLTPSARVIVGLSGGKDSMALLDLLTLLGYHCVAAHCNFHLRGEESDRDASFVKKWCKSIDVPFTSIDFDTRQYAADKKISIEMAARELRYSWFGIIRTQYDAEAVAVAHHRDDSVETVLLNLLRGTGIRGLTGISPKNREVIRPLLCVSRAEIEQYVAGRGLPHVDDSSNGEDIFLRNAIRINIIPRLEALNPAVRSAISRTAQHLTEVEKIYRGTVSEIVDTVFQDGRINIPLLRGTVSPQTVLFEILSPLGFGPSTIEDAFRCMDGTPGKVFRSSQYRMIKDRDYFLIDQIIDMPDRERSYFIDRETTDITVPIGLKIQTTDKTVELRKSRRFLYADYRKLQFPLELRRWSEGDWFVPFGMESRKKVSDYFTDRKFSLKDKENAWVLLSGGDIVWIVGERSDDRFRVTDSTTGVFIAESDGDQ